MQTGLIYFAAGLVIWVFTYGSNRVWVAFKNITGSW